MACIIHVLMAMILCFKNLTALRETEFHENTKIKNKMRSTEKRVFEVSAPSLISCLYLCSVNNYCRSSSYHSLKCYGCTTDAEDNTSVSQTGARTFTRMIGQSFKQGAVFDQGRSLLIYAVSGLVASRKYPGRLFTRDKTHENSKIHVVSINGTILATLSLPNVTWLWWEDISIGSCGGTSSFSCIYIGDPGIHGFNMQTIYRFREPDTLQDETITFDNANKLMFSWKGGRSEAIMVDEDTNVYIISHRGNMAMLPNTAWGSNKHVAITSETAINLPPLSNPTAGDISPNGNEVLVRTSESIYYWNTYGSHDYIKVLQTSGTRFPYEMELRVAAVCWYVDNLGYLTINREGTYKHIYFHERIVRT